MEFEVNGATLHYSVAGENNPQPMIVLHGGRGIGDHTAEFNAFRPLADQFRLIGYDQRGCGRSSLTPPFTFEQLTDDVEGVRRTLGQDTTTVLIGHEEAAIRNAMARLSKATSASVKMVRKIFSGVADDLELRLIWLAIQPLYFERFDPDAALARTRSMHFHAETHRALFRNKEAYDLRGRLKEIKAQTLVIVGERDWICPPDQSRIIAEGVPGARLLIIKEANHAVHIEKNERVIEAIRAFIH
jgi:proline iminopeptidase